MTTNDQHSDPRTWRCDFHATPVYADRPTWRYPAKDFTMALLGNGLLTEEHVSAGDWLACNPCHSLIERGDRLGLALRAAGVAAFASSESGLLRMLMDLHDRFRIARTGDAVPLALVPR